jgi:hypothetical protein
VTIYTLNERRPRETSENSSTPVEPVGGPELTREQAFVQTIRAEIDGYFCRLRQLNSLPPDAVFATLSAITARMGEIRLMLVRSDSRRMTALRTREVDPTIEECDRQFRLHSRIQAVRTFEWEVSGKGDV